MIDTENFDTRSIEFQQKLDHTRTESDVPTLRMDRWLFGPGPTGRIEEYVESLPMSALQLGQHIEFCRDMERDHGWVFMVVEHLNVKKPNSYVLLDSHGELYSVLSFQ